MSHIDAQDPNQAKKDERGRLYTLLQRKQGHAVIPHPSLGAPLLVEEGKPLTFFILSDSLLFELHRNCQEQKRNANAQADLAVRQVIGLHTRYQPFSEAMQDKTKPVVEGRLVCQNRDQLLQNLSYEYMGDIRELNGRLKDTSAEQPFIGQLHPLAANHFRQYHLNHLFKISIKSLNLTTGELYDLSWISYDEARENEAWDETP